MKFRVYNLEFRAVWHHSLFGASSTGNRVGCNLDLPITRRKVRRAIGWTMCTLTPTVNGKAEAGAVPSAQGDAACSASEPGGYSKHKGRVASFGSALKMAGFGRVARTELWKQYWEQHRQGQVRRHDDCR